MAGEGLKTGAEAEPSRVGAGEVLASTATIRTGQGDAVAEGLTLDKQRKLSEALKKLEDLIKEAKDKIKRAYNAKKTHMDGAKIEWTEDIFVQMLQRPLDELAKDWEADIKAKGEMDPKNAEKFNIQCDEAVKIAEQYLEKMTKETGWITPEVLAEMAKGAARKATLYTLLLNSDAPGSKDLIEAFKWAIGLSGKSGSLNDAKAKALKVLPGAITEEFSKGEKGLMPCIWMIMAFMSTADKVEVATSYLKGKSEIEVDAFLEAGNQFGALGPEEIGQIKGPKYTEKERERHALKWKLMNDFKAEAKKLTQSFYGSTNAANEMLTVVNVASVLGEFAAWATIAVNMLVSGFQGGEFHFPGPKQIGEWGKNHNIIGGAVVATGLRVMRSKKRLGETFAGEEERKTLARRAAIGEFKDRRQDALWPKWDGFFRSSGFNGAQAFADFTREMVAIYGEDLPEDRFTAESFLDYLQIQIDKKSGRNLDYEAVARSFKDLNAQDLKSYGQLFNNLNKANKVPNGQNVAEIYEGLIKDSEQT